MDNRHEMAIRLIDFKLLEIEKDIRTAAMERESAQRKIDNLTEIEKYLELSRDKLRN